MISREQYAKLCNVFNQILNLPGSTIEFVAIPWMHIQRAHPFFLKKYVFLFKRDRNIFLLFKKGTTECGLKIYRLLQAAIGSFKKDTISSIQIKQVDYLIISHLLKKEQYRDTQDFYFGPIPEELARNKKSVLVAYIPHFSGSLNLESISFSPFCSKIIFSRILSLPEEIKINRRLRHESKRISEMQKTGDIFFDSILNYARHCVTYDETRRVLRLFFQIQKLLKQVNPKAVILTYEGHSYERIIFRAIKNFDKRIKSFAYQHTGLFEHSNGVKQNIYGYDPDTILTCGVNDKVLLTKHAIMRNVSVEILGSLKGNDYKCESNEIFTLFIKKQMRCIVIPEGLLDECNVLLEFSLQCALLNPEIVFVWRLHPLISFNQLIKNNKKFRTIPPNIVFSERTIETDMETAVWALYRGSTAIYKALAFGVQPIYLKVEGEISIDPLYQMSFFKRQIISSMDFSEIVRERADFPEFKRKYLLLSEFNKNQFSNFKSEAILK